MAHDYDNKLMRLASILRRLNNSEALSVVEVANEFNVSERTIQRDFNEYLKCFFPIRQDKKKWKMKDGHQLQGSNIENIVVYYLMLKLIENSGQKFSTLAQNFLEDFKPKTSSPFYTKLNKEDTGDKYNDLLEFVEYLKMYNSASDDGVLVSSKNIKYYFDHFSVAIVKHISDSRSRLATFDNGKYVVLEKNIKYTCKYNSIEELMGAGWRIFLHENFIEVM